MDAFDRELLEVSGQRSSVWHDARLGRFTASEFWKLMQKGKSSIFSQTGLTYIKVKAAETLTGLKHQTSYAYPLVYGEELEPQAKAYFTKISGIEVHECSFVAYGDHAGGSPDGLIETAGIIEIKCPYNSENQINYLLLKDQWDLKAEFPEYYWQCQANLLFSERDYCLFATYDPRMKKAEHMMKTLTVEKDEDDHKLILERLAFAIKEKEEILNSI